METCCRTVCRSVTHRAPAASPHVLKEKGRQRGEQREQQMKFSCSFQQPPPPFIAEETVRLFLARHQKLAAIFRSQYEKKKKNTHTITSGEHLMLPPLPPVRALPPPQNHFLA